MVTKKVCFFLIITIILLSGCVQKSNVEKSTGEGKKEKKKFDLFESFEKIEKIEETCYLLKYPDFKMYVFRNSCSGARGKYRFEYNGITFLFDEESVYGILKEIASHDPVGLEKFVNNLEKIGNYILLLESDDGIKWRETDIVPARDCSVPDLVAGYDGKLYLYYVSFPRNKVDSVASEDGVKWKREGTDLEPGLVDPEIVKVNGVYRLYTNVGEILESKDGRHFERIGSTVSVMDPAVFQIGGKWYMIGEVPEEGMVLFSSEDGLNFKREKNLKIEGRVCDAFRKEEEVYLYCHLIEKDGSKILLYRSGDGENWKYVGKVYESGKMVADPTVAYFKGKYYMALTVVSSEKGKEMGWEGKGKHSKEESPILSGEGPWNERILIATSDDGIKWKKLNFVLADQASVPDVIVDRNGYVRIYYVDFRNKGITVAISKDLTEWEYVGVEGIEHCWEDPSVVQLPDGRFRLYASLSEKGVQRKIVSAISEDGIHFEPEGVVYESEFRVNDPDVVYADGKWIMVLNIKRDEGLRIGILASEDGLNFRLMEERDFGGAVPCIIRYGNGYRIYLHTEDHGAIISFYSEDLKTWSEEVTVLRKGEKGEMDSLGVESPSVARLEDGRYVMAYTTLIEPEHEKEAMKEKSNLLPEKPENMEEINVEFINSSYAIAQGGEEGGTFHTGQKADLMLSGFGFGRAGGALLFNHPSGIATDGKHLFLADTFNNRVLIWNSLPDRNVPPDIVLGQKDFYSNKPGTGRDEMNWPFSVATDGKHLIVSDVNNGRILIWNEIPTRNGEPADIVLEGGGSYYEACRDERLPGASWGVWTDGKRLVVVNTWSGGTVLIWNTFPTRDNQPADIVLRIPEMGTPRHVTSDGKRLIIGDHNAKVPGKPETGAFFWKEFPTSENQSYNFYMSKGFGWLRGAFLDDGKLLLLGGDGSFMRIWNGFPESENDEPDIELELESAALFPDDYMSVAVAGERIYISHGNMNRVICYKSLPTEPNQEPDFVIGAPDLRTNTLEKHFFIQNGVPASNGKNLFVASDFDRKLYVWKNLPDESGAYPDIVYTLPMQPWDIALRGNTLALAGERTVYIWKELPLKGNLPDISIHEGIGDIRFEELRGVTIDERYFYLSDSKAGKIYIWEGLPDEKTNPSPKFILNVENPMRLDSNGKYLAVALNGQPFVKIYDVDKLSSGVASAATLGGPGKMNLPQHAIVKHGMLFVADTCNNRVLVWNRAEEAVAGKWPPDAVLGKSDLHNSRPAIGQSSLFFPGALSFDGKYLWVGEFKFSNRIVRFTAR